MNIKRFKKTERIKKKYDIKKLFKTGEKVGVSGAKFFFARNKQNFNRIAFIFSHNFGSAVKRNRSKRFCREIFQILKTYLYEGFDIIFFVYPVENDSFLARYKQFEKLCKKAGLLKEQKNFF